MCEVYCMLITLNKATDKHIRNKYMLLYLLYLKMLHYSLGLSTLSCVIKHACLKHHQKHQTEQSELVLIPKIVSTNVFSCMRSCSFQSTKIIMLIFKHYYTLNHNYGLLTIIEAKILLKQNIMRNPMFFNYSCSMWSLYQLLS